MKEVSCRLFEALFRRMQERRLAPERLVAGTSVSLDTLRDPNGRIDWSDLVAILTSSRSLLSDDDHLAVGRLLMKRPAVRFATFLGDRLFTCITTTHRALSEDELEVEVRLDDGCEPCREIFVVLQGMLMEVARDDAVDRREAGPRATYRVHLEPIDPAEDVLEAARSKVDRQASQLRTAHAVSSLVHGDLDFDRTVETIARALVLEAGFSGARVEVDVDVDGVRLAKRVEQATVDDLALVRTLRGAGGRKLGAIWAGVAPGEDAAQRRRVLDFMMPTISMAIDNAVSFRVLESYRTTLEERVAERTERLEEAQAIRDRIFANINHEIRTPLSLILLAVEHSRMTTTSSRELDTIEGAARRLLRLVDELLLLAEGREGEIRLKKQRTDLAALIGRAVASWRPAARQQGLELSAELEPAWASVDPFAVERVVANLLSNATKYSKKGGAIRVSLAGRDGRALLEVKDDGAGIDDELRARLFGRFERGQRAIAEGVGGSGLGLSLVKELVEAQDGSVEVDSAPGLGTTVRVAWPLVDSSDSERDVTTNLAPQDFGVAVAVPEAKAIYEPPGPPLATLLLAEDDPSLRDEIARLLARDYRVVVAKDGEEALRLADEHQPDLLVTDVAMPSMDGIELTRRFVARTKSRVAPVLLLTAYGEIRDRLAGFEAGAVDYIVKPFQPDELRARIRSQLAVRTLALRLVDTERLAALGRLSAGLAHEIRNPANGIVNAVDPLRDVLPPACLDEGSPAAELLDVIAECSQRIAIVSRTLLGFRSGAVLEKKSVSLEGMLARAKAAARRGLDGIELRERFEYKGPIACAEPLLQQALANLLENAVQAAGRGGWVEIRTAREDGKVVVEVRDSGPGVAREHRDRLFEPFFTTKPPGAGTGLGLATSREIAVRHGGTLEARGSGPETVFRLEIPEEAR